MAGLFILALAMYLFIIPGGSFLILLTLLMLSMLYFYFGFAIFNGIRLRKLFKKESYEGATALKIIGAVVTGMSLSLTLIGTLFKLLRWPGGAVSLFAGCVFLLAIAVISLVKYTRHKSVYYVRVLKRVAAFGGLGFVLLLLPSTTLVDFRYRDHPAYRDALKNSMEHPDDPELQDKADEERSKLDGQ